MNPTRLDRKKGGPREYTHLHMGVQEDRGDSNEREEETSRPTSVDSPIQRDADYLNKKFKQGLWKMLMETTKMEKLKMRRWVVTPNF